MKRPSFDSVHVVVAEQRYCAIVRTVPARAPARVGADSPRYLEPGSRKHVQILRILRGGADVTDELLPWTRKAIEASVREQVR